MQICVTKFILVYILQHFVIQQFYYSSSISHSRVLLNKVTAQQPVIGAVSQLVYNLSLDCACFKWCPEIKTEGFVYVCELYYALIRWLLPIDWPWKCIVSLTKTMFRKAGIYCVAVADKRWSAGMWWHLWLRLQNIGSTSRCKRGSEMVAVTVLWLKGSPGLTKMYFYCPQG